MKIRDSLIRKLQQLYRLGQILEKARVRLRLLHHTEKDFGKEKRKYIFYRITKHFRQRITEFRFTDTMQIPLIQMLHLHLHDRKRHKQRLRDRRSLSAGTGNQIRSTSESLRVHIYNSVLIIIWNGMQDNPARFTQHITEFWKAKLQHFPFPSCFMI